jgi:hypothetical protein
MKLIINMKYQLGGRSILNNEVNEENKVLTTLLELKITGNVSNPSFFDMGLLEEMGLVTFVLDRMGVSWVVKLTDKGEKYIEQQS